MRTLAYFLLLGLAIPLTPTWAEAPLKAPRPTPVTRPEMKRLLEEMKEREARIPLPEPTAEEQALPDPRSRGYETRLRNRYLPGTDLRGYLPFAGSPPARPGEPPRFTIEPDPVCSLDYAFKTELFWIASRANNCQYCLGHQESKLLAVGMTDDQLAALDVDWSKFSPKEQAAFAFARRLTLEPHRLSDADIDACRKHFTDLQILEMALSVGGNNAINRWKEGIGVPQSTNGGNFGGRGGPSGGDEHSYLTPTSDSYAKTASKVASLGEPSAASPTLPTIFNRPRLDAAAIHAGLAAAAKRKGRLPVAEEAAARQALRENGLKENLIADLPEGKPVPQWMRLLSQFPVAGIRMTSGFLSMERNIGLDPLRQARIDFEIARQDSAWYALGRARQRMVAAGQSEAQIQSFIDGKAEIAPADQALLTLARNLSASPVVLTDAEVADAVNLAGPADVVKTVHYTAMRALFDRFTETAGLPLDP